ncbi:hypothetical protein IAU60_006129 [Kwoniella sp. DSM 27419]
MPLESNADKAYMHDLPKVSFKVITDDPSLLVPAGVQSEQSRSYGFNDFSDFERPDYYIRYIEPIESELAVQVEYDMDEQDQEWLDGINADRKKDQCGAISYEVFEIIMDKLEKEWFNLSKRIPQPTQHQTAEDSKCSVCDDGEGENSNAIVFCDGCNLAVHQDCYGVPYIPEGQWLCRKCTVSPENPVSCVFCPNEGGAFKQTTTGHWAHLLCAIWIPETGLGNAIYMEPVEGIESIPKSRWKLVCSLCRERTGACIQCENRNCFTAFHVTCARQVGLLQSMKSLSTDGILKATCAKHLPAESRDDESDTASNFSSWDEPAPAVTPAQTKARRVSGPVPISVTKKSAQAHSKSFRPGPPIVPKVILNKLNDYVAKVTIRKRQPFIERLCRYWSLKREARRGAPLLKRLHLEPWTASSASRQQTETEKAQKLKFLQMLRNDLEKVRMLAELVRKREKEKLRQVQVIKDVVDKFVFPHSAKLRDILERIAAMDKQELFLHPVNRAEVPDYFDVIREPMCWLFISEQLDKNGYLNVTEFMRHILLVLDNAMAYNGKDNPYHRQAARIRKSALPILDELEPIRKTAVADATLPSGGLMKPIGDLEPSTLLLSALLHPVNDEDQPSNDLLSTIISFELEKPKEPTPPPAEKPVKARKSLSAAEKKARWEEREAAAKERALSRSTRAAKAAESAFREEAGIQLSSEADISAPQTPIPDEDGDPRSRRRSMRNSSSQAGSSRLPLGADQSQVKTGKHVHVDGSSSDSPLLSSNDSIQPRNRKQRGVIGVEAIPVLTDRERREQERKLDIITDEVGAQEQFMRFNVGWVLPEGSKRRRSERPPDPSAISQRPSNLVSSRKPPSAVSKAITPPPPIVTKALVEGGEDAEDEILVSGSDLSSPPPSSILTSAAPTPTKPTKNKRKADNDTPVANKRTKFGHSQREGEATEPTITLVPADDEDEDMTPVPDEIVVQVPAAVDTPANDESLQSATPVKASKPVQLTRSKSGRFERRSDSRKRPSKASKKRMVDGPPAAEGSADIANIVIQTNGEGGGDEPTAETDENHADVTGVDDGEKAEENGEDADETQELVIADNGEAPEEVDVDGTGEDSVGEAIEVMPEQAVQDKGKLFPPGTIVWAKVLAYPFFPAMVMDPADPVITVHQGFLADESRKREEAKKRNQKNLWPVRFFDTSNSLGWVADDRIDVFGVDEGEHLWNQISRRYADPLVCAAVAIDEQYLWGKVGTNKSKGFRSTNQGKQVKKSYAVAMAMKTSEA